MEASFWALVILTLIMFGALLRVYEQSVRWFIFYLTTDIPGPSLWQLLKLAPKHLNSDFPLEVIHQLSESYGFKPWGMWMNGYYLILISDPHSVTELFKSKHAFDKSTFMYKYLAEHLADGLITLNGPAYLRHRKLISSAFRTELLHSHLPRVNEDSQQFLEQLDTFDGETVPIHSITHEQSFTTALSIFFSGKFSQRASVNAFVHGLSGGLEIAHKKALNPVGYWFNRSYKKLEDEVAFSMSKFKSALLELKSDASVLVEGDGRPVDHFQVLHQKTMKEGDDRLTEEEFIEETKTVISAAFETTASSANACMYFLALNPEVQKHVYDEMISIFGESDRPVEPEDLPKMVYLEQVIKESLRIFPPGVVISRQALQDIPLSGVKAPKGCVIVANVWSLHRNPEFYKDPLKFDPDRFSPENCASRPQFAFAAFSGGGRRCPGQAQGYMVLKTLLSHIVRNFEIAPGEGLENVEKLKLVQHSVLKIPSLPLRFMRRHERV